MTMIRMETNLVKIIKIPMISILMAEETLIPVEKPTDDHILFIKQSPNQKRATSLIMTIRSKIHLYSLTIIYLK